MRGGFYERRVFPWLNDALGKAPALQELRRETLAAASGRVVEIGFGSGGNLPYYPSGVASVTGVEPNAGMTDRAVRRRQESPAAVRIVLGLAEGLPFLDGTFDAAVSTLTLCSVQDPARVLDEVHRVLRVGGVLFVLEHGLSDDSGVARWQQRLNGFQRVVACGCNLNRSVMTLVTSAGFEFDEVRTFFAPGIPRTHGWITAGRAIKRA
jgi:ubiquinone/menaquinone biosynthesis C-methylase UbiE